MQQAEASLKFHKTLESFLAQEFYSKLPNDLQNIFSRLHWDFLLSESEILLVIESRDRAIATQLYERNAEVIGAVREMLSARNLIDLSLGIAGHIQFCASSKACNDLCPLDSTAEYQAGEIGDRPCLALRFGDTGSSQRLKAFDEDIHGT